MQTFPALFMPLFDLEQFLVIRHEPERTNKNLDGLYCQPIHAIPVNANSRIHILSDNLIC